MRHRTYIASIPVRLARAFLRDLFGDRRAVPMTATLAEAALDVRPQLMDAADTAREWLRGATWWLLASASLGALIFTEVTRKLG